MNGIATVTQRGQVVIPQPIRHYFNLKPSDKVSFELEENKIVIRPIISLNEAFGIAKSHKMFSKRDYKKAIIRKVLNKFSQ